MNSKERVYAAIRHESVDRLPRYIWVGRGAAEQLRAVYGEEIDIDEFLGNDVRQTWLSINGQMEKDCLEGESFVDEWGIRWHRDGYYNAVIEHPLANLDEEEIHSYPFPDPDCPERYVKLRSLIEQYGEDTFIGADVSGCLFEPAYHLRGMENLMMDMASEDSVVDMLLDRLCEFTTRIAVNAAKMGVDWIWLGDDMGTQESMLISPEMWRTYFKPRMKKIITAIHEVAPEMIIAYHSCGSIYPIIGELAEIGIQVLNPLQESARGMEHHKLKAQYGDRLTFMCGLDTQNFMVHATAEQVCAAMKEKSRMLSKNGGYIVGVSHTLQHDVSVKNIVSMIEGLS